MARSTAGQEIPLHWLQALRDKSALFTPEEARRILGWPSLASEPTRDEERAG